MSRLVEVAAGETAAMNLAGAIGTKPAVGSDTQAPPSGSDRGGNGLIIAGWVGTGALAAGAVVTGILASSKASSLKDARAQFPGHKADLDSMSRDAS